MKKTMTTIIATTILSLPIAATAETAKTELTAEPGPKAVKDVVNYFYGGANKPVLTDIKLCADIYRQGAEQYNCHGELNPESLASGESIYVWMNYLVPKGKKLNMLLQTNYHGVTRDTHSFDVSGGIRYRVWKKINLEKVGQWDIPIFYEESDELHELSNIQINVQGASFAKAN